ncbi:MAG: DUF3098 domain-containing protein [bacterium]|nr:DUF3098 domain-containing protein [bacterium]
MAKQKKALLHDRPLFGKRNWRWLGIGVGTLIIGYICLMQGPYNNPLSLTVAPILLVLGYCIFIPLGLALRPEEEKKQA